MAEDIFKLIANHKFSSENCFLCGTVLDNRNRTEEHVIPKWIQREFNLWNQTITLLNGTKIPYRYLTIPCCNICNNRYLEPFERRIHVAYNKGYSHFRRLNKNTIYLWLCKIYSD